LRLSRQPGPITRHYEKEEQIMRQRWMTGLVAGVVTLAVVGGASAAEKVTVTREENKPAKVSIKAGEEVYWVNGTGGTAHITFGRNAPQFYLGKGNNRIKFTEPGTYEYSVHVSGVKGHGHTGTVEVK
jgi:plastocyanin